MIWDENYHSCLSYYNWDKTTYFNESQVCKTFNTVRERVQCFKEWYKYIGVWSEKGDTIFENYN